MMSHGVLVNAGEVCENCSKELNGGFCHECGQQHLGEHGWSFKHFVHHAWHEIVHLDSKIFRTLKLLVFRPGMLTREYLDGHRVPYVNPIRLYLAMTGLFLLFGSQTDFDIRGFERTGDASGLVNLVTAMAGKKGVPFELEVEHFNKGFHSKFSIAMALMVLVFGWMVHLVYRKQEAWYARSLVFAIHFYSLFFLLLLAWRLTLHYLPGRPPMQGFFLLVLPFLLLSVRRVWPGPVGKWLPRGLWLWVCAIFTYAIAIAMGIGVQISTYGRLLLKTPAAH